MIKPCVLRCLQQVAHRPPPLMHCTRCMSTNLSPSPDWSYLLNTENTDEIRLNIANRKGVGDIEKVMALHKLYQNTADESVWKKLVSAALLIPNRTNPNVPDYPKLVKNCPPAKESENPRPESFRTFTHKAGLLRFGTPLTSNLVNGVRSYYLLGDLAKLERVLVKWCLDKLRMKGWKYVSVPDMLPESLINACGFVTTGKQNQVFKTQPIDSREPVSCLAGTSEMALAGLFAGTTVTKLPQRVCAVSSCYRAEEAKNRVDKDFYRVHQFTKVEMFGVSHPDHSDALLNEIVETQCEIFSELGLNYRLLDMPAHELGAPAYRKYDIEAFLRNKLHWGELSSASNCTDYQARRLNITLSLGDSASSEENRVFAHTLNGTAIAIPRLLMAIVEQNQTRKGGHIIIPECLQPYMQKSTLKASPQFNKIKWIHGKPNIVL